METWRWNSRRYQTMLPAISCDYELDRVDAVLAADTRGDECADEMTRGLRETVTAGMLSLNDLCWWMEEPVLLRSLDPGRNGARRPQTTSLKRYPADLSTV